MKLSADAKYVIILCSWIIGVVPCIFGASYIITCLLPYLGVVGALFGVLLIASYFALLIPMGRVCDYYMEKARIENANDEKKLYENAILTANPKRDKK